VRIECWDCPLAKTRTNIVHGNGPKHALAFLVGEAPGKEEDRAGEPFVGKAGKELDGQYLHHFAGIPRNACYVTNLVKCRPPRNRDPKPEEISACGKWLEKELDRIEPSVIVTLGRYSLAWFLGEEADLSVIHGIPQYWYGEILLPCYHPAAGLHDTRMMIMIQRDFEMLGKVLRGEAKPEYWDDPIQNTDYRAVEKVTVTGRAGVDTESRVSGGAWSVQVSSKPGTACFLEAGKGTLTIPSSPESEIILHNALHDLPVLNSLGITVPRYHDTMIMAYLLQDEPQGLKALAYRHCGMKMQSYEEVIREATREKATGYLKRVLEREWPTPEPVLEWRSDGTPRARQPQPIEKKVKKILKDTEEKGADPYERWYGIDKEEGRGEVERVLGKMEKADLSEVEFDKALTYSCRDADATLRIFLPLWRRICELDLEDAYWLDISVIPVVVDMQRTGLPVSRDHFLRLSAEFGKHMDDLQEEISKLVGAFVNPGSSKQVASLLFHHLKLPKVSKPTATGQATTDRKTLEKLRNKHPVVPLILKWREYEKLRSTYTDVIPEMIGLDGRLHTEILMTRAATGRFASRSPNLQNVPVRTDEGKRIREGFVCGDRTTFISIDFSEVELRLLAHESQDPVMLEVYRSGGGIHSRTVEGIFGIPPERQDDRKHRKPCKVLNFGMVYGMSVEGFRDQLAAMHIDWPLDECRKLMEEWFNLYKGVKRYMMEQEAYARRYGYVRFGRIRRIPEMRSVHRWIQSQGAREAGNAPIQGKAAEVMKRAMRDLRPHYLAFQEAGWVCSPLLTIHDELLFEVSDEIVGAVVSVFSPVMENCISLSVPLKVDAKVGKVWGRLEKWKGGGE